MMLQHHREFTLVVLVSPHLWRACWSSMVHYATLLHSRIRSINGCLRFSASITFPVASLKLGYKPNKVVRLRFHMKSNQSELAHRSQCALSHPHPYLMSVRFVPSIDVAF